MVAESFWGLGQKVPHGPNVSTIVYLLVMLLEKNVRFYNYLTETMVTIANQIVIIVSSRSCSSRTTTRIRIRVATH